MVWKILSGISAACLAGSAYFAWENQNQLKTEKMRRTWAEQNLAELETKNKEAADTKDRKTTQVAQLEKDRDAAKEDVVEATAEAQQKEQELALAKSTLDQLSQQVATLNKKIEDAGDIKKLLAQVETLKADQTAAEGELANKDQQLASANSRVEALLTRKSNLEDTIERMTRGVVDPEFQARVSGVFPEWGFVVLNKGNSQGAFANALLEVKRGNDVVAKLRIKNVEPSISVADVVEGSLTEGEVVRTGDLVVADAAAATAELESRGKNATPSTTDGSTPAPESPTPTPDAAAPMSSDPFGGGTPAPAAPAGGAPMNGDPFGAPTPAPAAGAAPMNSDPFGSSTPTTPPPKTADPFGN
ncbi:MAG: hypothetical protein KDK99_09395 [Verrucomicrobiales bacterium]|nr:hypothetical protein [Verrucomicrobiales bacterium]